MKRSSSPYRIYNASAGSGKTFTLTLEYLKLLLRPGANQAFRKILAITFTNKAVTELKQRILHSLVAFSSLDSLKETAKEYPLFKILQEELEMDPKVLSDKSRRILKEILHNYAFFDISTIDKFNHRLLRTFSKDLSLPANFEVVIDSDFMLETAVDNLLSKAGSDKELSEVLIDFALEKAAEDKSWDISRDLFEMGKLLFNENHLEYLKTFEGKKMKDFQVLKSELRSRIQRVEKELLETAEGALKTIEENGLERLDFKAGYFPDFLNKIAAGDFQQDFTAKWKQEFGNEPLFKKNAPQQTQDILTELMPEFNRAFQGIKERVIERSFLINVYTQLAPFTVLGLLQQELKTIQTEEGMLPIAFFNAIIARELKDEPAPFIYERLGEKYRHYFIDEFQDTSELQWNNLVPLIDNALSGIDETGQKGSLVLVGDAKQAIYRWRGGRAEQFIGLFQGGGNPFPIPAETFQLPSNFRSNQTIVTFNNQFFSHISQFLNNRVYQSLFIDGNKQESHSKEEGMVRIEFIPEETENTQEAYQLKVLDLVREVKNKGYAFGDICVLTRRRAEGVLISDILIGEGIPVISSETLLLASHAEVQFLIHLLCFLREPGDRNHSFGLIQYLTPENPEAHDFIAEKLRDPEGFLRTTYGFDCQAAILKPVYDILETAIRQFKLATAENAYLIFLMDVVLEVGQTTDHSINTFLEYWEHHKESLSVLAPEHMDAVRIMTIHKSKGLEFPIVIFPFADAPVYPAIKDKLWIPVNPEAFNGFPFILAGMKKDLEQYGGQAAHQYIQEREKQELDAFNVLYVVHTRAAKGLYVLSKAPKAGKIQNPADYSSLYMNYLQESENFENSGAIFQKGSLPVATEKKEAQETAYLSYMYSNKESQLVRVVTPSARNKSAEQETSISYGNLIHTALSLVETEQDVPAAVQVLLQQGAIDQAGEATLLEIIYRVVRHPLLKEYFREGPGILNERDIISENGLLLRPDRMIFENREVTVIDYKTGKREISHREQIELYGRILESMGYTLKNTILIYIEENNVIPEFI
ncbi:UvrD-helicase domain-containing protein [Robiginitalea sp. IMCC44478]|uniref:UvrD-helicase domain-containing protein n=1 Tax=Robiginitalea sp. IMCC44478 TaxID=3459122 RepID=UPI00404356F5